jgi:hypothetical protein
MWLSLRAILLARLRHGSGRQLIFDPARRNGKNQPHELNCVLTYYHIVAPKCSVILLSAQAYFFH